MSNFVDMTGEIYGKWTVLKQAGRASRGHVLWLCRCECGREKEVRGDQLRAYKSLSCGGCHVNDEICKIEGCDRPRLRHVRLCSHHEYEAYHKGKRKYEPTPEWMKGLVSRKRYDR